MKMLAVYDIADPKRLTKVAKVLKDYGVRVQYSKFELDLTGERMFLEMQSRILEIIEPDEDGVKCIPLCKSCRLQIDSIGKGTSVNTDEEYCVL